MTSAGDRRAAVHGRRAARVGPPARSQGNAQCRLLPAPCVQMPADPFFLLLSAAYRALLRAAAGARASGSALRSRALSLVLCIRPAARRSSPCAASPSGRSSCSCSSCCCRRRRRGSSSAASAKARSRPPWTRDRKRRHAARRHGDDPRRRMDGRRRLRGNAGQRDERHGRHTGLGRARRRGRGAAQRRGGHRKVPRGCAGRRAARGRPRRRRRGPADRHVHRRVRAAVLAGCRAAGIGGWAAGLCGRRCAVRFALSTGFVNPPSLPGRRERRRHGRVGSGEGAPHVLGGAAARRLAETGGPRLLRVRAALPGGRESRQAAARRRLRGTAPLPTLEAGAGRGDRVEPAGAPPDRPPPLRAAPARRRRHLGRRARRHR